MKAKRCKHCKESFQPSKPMQSVCSPLCAHQLVQANKVKAKAREGAEQRKETKAKLDALKTKPELLREALTAFQAWIRWRDRDEPCISCGRHHTGQYHGGHYRSRGAMPALAFSEDNCHKQCAPCNTNKSGNVVEYRIRLLSKIGAERLGFIEGPHPVRKYTADELRALKAEYRSRLKEANK